MGKYTPLGEYLRSRSAAEIAISFEDIERIIDAPLPPAANRHAAFWSNNPSNNVMTKVWVDAGYRSEKVDLGARKLVFRRFRSKASGAAEEVTGKELSLYERLRNALSGTVTFAPGFDPTEPTGEVWDAEL